VHTQRRAHIGTNGRCSQHWQRRIEPYGAPWLQPVATVANRATAETAEIGKKTLPWVATRRREQRMVRVMSIRPPSAKEGATSLAPLREVESANQKVLRDG